MDKLYAWAGLGTRPGRRPATGGLLTPVVSSLNWNGLFRNPERRRAQSLLEVVVVVSSRSTTNDGDDPTTDLPFIFSTHQRPILATPAQAYDAHSKTRRQLHARRPVPVVPTHHLLFLLSIPDSGPGSSELPPDSLCDEIGAWTFYHCSRFCSPTSSSSNSGSDRGCVVVDSAG